jgi:hypothetical protein
LVVGDEVAAAANDNDSDGHHSHRRWLLLRVKLCVTVT